MRFKAIFNQIKKAFIPCALVLVACSSLLLGWGGTAQAGDKAASVVKGRAEREFDRVAGEGSINQVEGTAQEGLGKVQRQLGDDAEGTARELRGKAQKNVGRTQEAADKATDKVEEQAEGLVDKVKDFFD